MADEEKSHPNHMPPAGGPPPHDRFPPPGMLRGPPPNMRGPPPGLFPSQFPPNGFGGGMNMPPPGFHQPFGARGPPPSNTTLPKPPIIDKEGNAWFEACTAEGKVYYFHGKTRETKWEKPDSVSDKKETIAEEVTTADTKEDEKEVAKKVKEVEVKEEEDKPKKPEEESSEVKQPIVPANQTKTVVPPQSNHGQPASNHGPPHRMPPPGFGGPPPFGMHPMMRPPPRMPPNFNGPPFMNRMPPPGMMQGPPGMPPGFPPFPGFRLPPPDFIPKTKGEWTEHRLPDGRLYYFNNKTKESKWDKPSEFLKDDKSTDNNKEGGENKQEDGDKVKKDGDEKKPEGGETKKEEKDTKQKPIASKPVSGTGWHLVWTGDGKVFFFHPTTKTSIWERPKELENNPLVDEILRKGPLDKSSEKKIEVESDVSVDNAVNDVQMTEVKKVEKKPAESSIVDESEPEIKKKKLDEQNEDITDLPVVSEKHIEKKKEENQKTQMIREAQVKKAIIPLHERTSMFTQLLREKEVSAFSTWEKELHKILFDPRYLLLTMKERKNCYEIFVKTRAVEERKERIQKLREKKDDFKKLLDEVMSSARTTFSEFASKNSKDDRYKAIEKMRDRESLFTEFMTDFKKHERERLKIREEKLRKNFYELLDELNNITEDSLWKKVKTSIETDRRYELVGSSSKREQFFYDYIKEKTIKKGELAEDEEPTHAPPASESSEVLPAEPGAQEERPPSPPIEDEASEGLDKIERIEASIRKREEEVRAQKELYEKDREKERGYHLHNKAVQHFTALLADMVKDTQYSWKDTRRSLRKDPRWGALEILDKTEKEALFNDHISDIKDKRKKSFRKLLDSADITLDAYWRDVRKTIKDDPRYSKFGTSESREEEFEQYMRERLTDARTDFRDLLRETKLITYKSKKVAEDNPSHVKDIHEILKKDKRYHMLSTLSHERDRMITSHMEDTYKRGPPPPPTATNPSLRYKKD